MLNLLSEISLCVILAGLLGLYIGYLLAQDNCNKTQEDSSAH